MSRNDTEFTGSIPEIYDTHLGTPLRNEIEVLDPLVWTRRLSMLRTRSPPTSVPVTSMVVFEPSSSLRVEAGVSRGRQADWSLPR